ncbi:MAG TPA: D-amino acid aminotransferase [Steroidobacteraceae bacterium]|nr:D-amino acid aminotransferase [Steroidobacteraceae bacterium]
MAAPLSWCHLDGKLLPVEEARISPFDRSFLFGDGIYEVMPVYGGRLFRPELHFERLARSATALKLTNPHPHAGWQSLLEELISANGGGDQYIYLHLSRGAEEGRNHAPLPSVPPLVMAWCAPWPAPAEATLRHGLACITAPDPRWARCDIKSVALLANVLLRQQAIDAGASEAILLRDGELTEGSASTVHVVRDGVLLTPPDSQRILPGTTRRVVEEIADRLQIPRRATRIEEPTLRAADEIWLGSATREVQPVTLLDGKPVGTGKPGPLWRRVYDAFQALKHAAT